MAKNADFESFLKDINPSETTISEASRLQNSLRDHLKTSENYKEIHRNTYLSGSYAKHTFIRPKKDSDSCDIDIIVETNHTIEDDPCTVLTELKDNLAERSCYKNVRIQNHSVGIEMSNFHIDVVPLAKDSKGMLYIGSSEDGQWKKTNPKGHISWSTDVNQEFSGDYKPLVKIMKWWRRENCPTSAKYPKGITLEKIIADNLPDSGLPIEDRIMQTMANISAAYTEEIDSLQVPFVEDPSLEGNNLAVKYRYWDFKQFISKINEHLALLAEEGTGNSTWKKVLGNNFPSGKTQNNSAEIAKTAYQEIALAAQHRQTPKFHMQAPKLNASITATVTLPSGKSYSLDNDSTPIPKGSSILYRVNCGPVKGAKIYWQVTNTGEEAMSVCPRGEFNPPNHGKTSRHEETAYTGKHYVQCFIVRNGSCIRWTKPFFINVE